MWIGMRPSHGGHATGWDDITPGRAALRNFKPVYVGSGSNSVLGQPLADVRITPESRHSADIGGRLKCANNGHREHNTARNIGTTLAGGADA
jgi:hypothetical protein